MKKQGYNARLDESLGMKHRGPHQQSLKSRRDESKGMSKSRYGHAYEGNHNMKEDKHYPKSVKGKLHHAFKTQVGSNRTGIMRKS
mgnify:CR=1 FL=1